MRDRLKKGYISVFAAGVFWGTTGLCVRLLSDQGLTALQVAFFLQLFGLLFMLPTVLSKCGAGALKIDPRLMVLLALTGFVSEALYDICYTSSVTRVGVAFAGVLLYLSPVFVMIIARFAFRERITKKKLFALVLNVAGCFVTVTGLDLRGFDLDPKGILFGVLAALCYGMITIFDKYTADKAHPFVITFYILLFGFLFVALISRCWTFWREVMTPQAIALGAMAGLLAAQMPYTLFVYGIACGVEASRAPILASVEVVIAALIGVLAFKEELGPVNALGIAAVLVSIAVLSSGRSGGR